MRYSKIKSRITIYQIIDTTTGDVLSDNLRFEDMPELLGAFMDFYPRHELQVICEDIVVCDKDNAMVFVQDELNDVSEYMEYSLSVYGGFAQ